MGPRTQSWSHLPAVVVCGHVLSRFLRVFRPLGGVDFDFATLVGAIAKLIYHFVCVGYVKF
jgi:hypothetical protein